MSDWGDAEAIQAPTAVTCLDANARRLPVVSCTQPTRPSNHCLHSTSKQQKIRRYNQAAAAEKQAYLLLLALALALFLLLLLKAIARGRSVAPLGLQQRGGRPGCDAAAEGSEGWQPAGMKRPPPSMHSHASQPVGARARTAAAPMAQRPPSAELVVAGSTTLAPTPPAGRMRRSHSLPPSPLALVASRGAAPTVPLLATDAAATVDSDSPPPSPPHGGRHGGRQRGRPTHPPPRCRPPSWRGRCRRAPRRWRPPAQRACRPWTLLR